jgi:hypothetical protein
MKLIKTRNQHGTHNGTQDSIAIPVPSEIKNQGPVALSWNTHKGDDDKDIHSIWFHDEEGNLIACHTIGDDDIRPWDKVLHIITKFRRNALRIMDELNKTI